MPTDDLAHELARTDRPGLDDALATKLKIVDEDITRARLRSQASEGRAHVVVHLLGAWVEDCRDIGKGEVYWWSIPMLGGADGKIRWNALAGLPNGAQPVSVGNKSWLGGIALDKPPVLAVASPDEDVAAVMVRIGFYEDDWAPALLGPALKAGMTVLADYKEPAKDVDGFVLPIRQAIWDSLKAKQDDFMLEKDVKLLREEGGGFGAGTISSHLTQYIRVYLFARDVDRTEVAGPFKLTKGQDRRIVFPSSLEGGGRIAIFARGTVKADRFGTLDVNQPFVDHAIDEKEEGALAKGLTITAEEDAEVIAYFTPKREALRIESRTPMKDFLPLPFVRRPVDEMRDRARSFLAEIRARRTVRHFSPDLVPRDVLLSCIEAAAQAPSGAHKQPWTFALVEDAPTKRAIREAAEREEKAFYGGRAPERWLQDLEPFGTDAHKPYLEIAPALIVVFAQKHGEMDDEKHYYVNESVGIATGFLLAALHHAGLATLTHTPSPMTFLSDILGRPKNERAYLIVVVGYPEDGCKVPDIERKKLRDVLVVK